MRLWAKLCFLIILFGCQACLPACRQTRPARQVRYPYETATVPPPARGVIIPLPPGECTAHCEAIMRAQRTASFIGRQEQLLKVASVPELTLHEQLHLINVSLSLEMFGMDEVFLALAQHRYLRYTAKDYLMNLTNRLSFVNQTKLTELLRKNPGVPDELTPVEKLWRNYFSLDEYKILDYHHAGFSTDDILLIIYIARHSIKESKALVEWRGKGVSWRDIALDKAYLEPSLLFVELPLDSPISEPFKRLYDLYWIWSERGAKKEWLKLTDQELAQLVQLKVIHTYYAIPVLEIMKAVAEGKGFDEIIQGRERQTKKGLR